MKTYGKVEQLCYSIIRRRGVKNVTMRVDEAGCIAVTAPYGVSKAEIESILCKNKGKLDLLAERKKENLHTYEAGDVFLFEGESYPLVYRKDYQYNILIEDKQLVATYFGEKPDKNIIAHLIKENYRLYAYFRIHEMLPVWAKALDVKVPSFTVRDTKKRWGSCSSQGTLNFSLRTQMLSDEQLSFLILHELSHLVHFNHSSDFHELMYSHMPNYREVEKKIFSMEKQGLFTL